MTKIDIYSGFLGAGKTTLIKKMIQEAYTGEKLVLIENEFGEIGIDGGFLQEAGIEITEMNSGCICCSLVGDFGKALEKVISDYAPDRILIEPSGVGKLSDVIAAVQKVTREGVELGSFVTVADATKCKMYMKNFGEFYNNQIETANTIVLSRTDAMSPEKLDACVAMIREHNAAATLVTTPWQQITGEQLMQAMEQRTSIADELAAMEAEARAHHHDEDEEEEHHCCHHHHHDEDEEEEEEHHCCHHHHHDEDEEEEHHCCHHHRHDEDEEEEHHCCHHHHHDEDEEEEHHCCHHHHHDEDAEEEHHCCHHHHHDEDEEEEHHCCHHHGEEHEHHHHHHGHDADEVFVSWGEQTHKQFTAQQIADILHALEDEQQYGIVLRAKGYVANRDAERWIHFDYVPGESDIRDGCAMVTGRVCVIGSKLNEPAIAALFGVEH